MDSIPLVPTKENGTDHQIIDIPVAAMLSSKDAKKLLTLIEKTNVGVSSSSHHKESLLLKFELLCFYRANEKFG